MDMESNRTIECPSRGDRAPSAVSHVSKLNGSSQPSIVSTEDGTLYVVKFREFTGRNGLLSEVIGAELMSRMGLPVPKWDPICFTDVFIDGHPEMWRRSHPKGAGIRPGAGFHFGSLLTRSVGENHTYELIPNSWIDRVRNRQDFVGALLLDLWTNNCDRRQCVFVAEGSAKSLHAVFIDNDHMFGGYFGNEKTCPRRAMVPYAGFYDGCWTDGAVARWKRIIDGIDDEFLDSVMAKVPPDWADVPALQFARTELGLRRSRLESLISEVEQVLRNGRFPAFLSPQYALVD
jgi:hypothetical protein